MMKLCSVLRLLRLLEKTSVSTIYAASAVVAMISGVLTPSAVAANASSDADIVGPARFRVIISSDLPPLDVIPGKTARPGDPPEKCSDPDDLQSMIRFLLYTNEFDVEGLVASAGSFANLAKKQNVLAVVNLYAQVSDNLRRHDPRYPTADKLRSITWEGRSGVWGTPSFGAPARPIETLIGTDKDSEASEAIIRVVDRPDPRPVWFCAWGGSREVAQAIWKVRATRSPAELARFIGKLRLYLIAKQDGTTDWMLDNFPTLFVILSERNYMGMFCASSATDAQLVSLDWTNAHIRKGHGPLGAAYPRSGWDPATPGVWEGDTPSYLHLISALRGVNNPEKPDQGGWGGKFVRPDSTKNHWFDDPAGGETVSRWRPKFQAEFAQRAEWMLP